MAAIYGKYSSYLTQDRLEDKFNDWMGRKLLVICDEVLANKGKSRHANQLKTSITQATAPVRRMYAEYVEEENHANFVFLSNETLPVLIDPDDRRYMISRQEKKLSEEFYEKCAKQIRDGGRKAFAKFLLEFDLGEFGEHTKPPMNEAKRDLIAICEPAPIMFLKAWSSGELDLPYCTCSSADLYLAFRAWQEITNEYGNIGFNKFVAEVRRMAEGEKIPGICKGKPRIEANGVKTQVNGWSVDISDDTRIKWFPYLDYGSRAEELLQTRKFAEATKNLKEMAEKASMRRTYKE
jgi:hypothetical protein